MRMIAVGDNVVDCYLDQRVYYPGGNAVNVAVEQGLDGCVEVVVEADAVAADEVLGGRGVGGADLGAEKAHGDSPDRTTGEV